MPKCYNCGCDIPSGDKTRLCDSCKKFMLPFIKFMDASTSSSTRRLLSNEKNLRNAGVTDKGMEYLLKICELHDRQKLREREEREAAKAAAGETRGRAVPAGRFLRASADGAARGRTARSAPRTLRRSADRCNVRADSDRSGGSDS